MKFCRIDFAVQTIIFFTFIDFFDSDILTFSVNKYHQNLYIYVKFIYFFGEIKIAVNFINLVKTNFKESSETVKYPNISKETLNKRHL